jgi:hypothetical protein
VDASKRTPTALCRPAIAPTTEAVGKAVLVLKEQTPGLVECPESDIAGVDLGLRNERRRSTQQVAWIDGLEKAKMPSHLGSAVRLAGSLQAQTMAGQRIVPSRL